MQRRIVKEGLGGLIGNAGEYLVVGELLKRGVVASPAPRNTPAFDVLVTSPDGKSSANIRVKTLSPRAKSWVWNDKNAKKRKINTADELKPENISIFSHIKEEGDFTVLVDLKDDESPPEFFITPTKKLNEVVVSRFLCWLREKPKGEKARDLHNPMLRYGDRERDVWLRQYRNNWNLVKSYLGLS